GNLGGAMLGGVRLGLFEHICACYFQADDGIRDFHVTGVQTCALPIWPSGARDPARSTRGRAAPARRSAPPRRTGTGTASWPPRRSEERRVGKECGAPWSAWPNQSAGARARKGAAATPIGPTRPAQTEA